VEFIGNQITKKCLNPTKIDNKCEMIKQEPPLKIKKDGLKAKKNELLSYLFFIFNSQ